MAMMLLKMCCAFVRKAKILFPLFLCMLFLHQGVCSGNGNSPVSRVLLSPSEQQLYELLMAYRRENGFSSIPLSRSLCRVARLNVRDLMMHPPQEPCNLHSWSAYGPWKACCYRGSGSAEHMWSKPRELTAYTGNGYEIAYYSSRAFTPADALEAWKRESQHEAVMLNRGGWSRQDWNAVGVAMRGRYAVIWFGTEPDL